MKSLFNFAKLAGWLAADVNNGVQQGKTGLSSKFCRYRFLYFVLLSVPRGLHSDRSSSLVRFCIATHAVVIKVWVIARGMCIKTYFVV